MGLVDDFMVVAGNGGFQTVVETAGSSSLQASDQFETATSALSEDRLGLFYGDVSSLQDGDRVVDARMFGRLLVAGSLGDGTIAGSVVARNDALVLEMSSGLAESRIPGAVLRGYARESTLDELPGHAWFALRIPKAGRALDALMSLSGARRDPGWRRFQRLLRKGWNLRIGKDVLSWMRGATVYAGGRSLQDLDAGLFVRSARPTKSMAFVDVLAGGLRWSGFRLTRLPSFAREVDFDVHVPTLPQPVHVTSTGGFSATYGRTLQQAFREKGFLDYSEVFTRATEALGDDYQPALFVDGEKARRFGESTFVGAGKVLPRAYLAGARPFLEHLDYVVQGIDIAGDRVLQQIVIGVE